MMETVDATGKSNGKEAEARTTARWQDGRREQRAAQAPLERLKPQQDWGGNDHAEGRDFQKDGRQHQQQLVRSNQQLVRSNQQLVRTLR